MELANLILCGLGGWLCICRLRHLGPDSKLPIKVRYLMWLIIFSASSMSWAWGYPATVPQIIIGLCVVIDLSLGFRAWRDGPPQYVKV